MVFSSFVVRAANQTAQQTMFCYNSELATVCMEIIKRDMVQCSKALLFLVLGHVHTYYTRSS